MINIKKVLIVVFGVVLLYLSFYFFLFESLERFRENSQNSNQTSLEDKSGSPLENVTRVDSVPSELLENVEWFEFSAGSDDYVRTYVRVDRVLGENLFEVTDLANGTELVLSLTNETSFNKALYDLDDDGDIIQIVVDENRTDGTSVSPGSYLRITVNKESIEQSQNIIVREVLLL